MNQFQFKYFKICLQAWKVFDSQRLLHSFFERAQTFRTSKINFILK